jgi:hypothetical protein
MTRHLILFSFYLIVSVILFHLSPHHISFYLIVYYLTTILLLSYRLSSSQTTKSGGNLVSQLTSEEERPDASVNSAGVMEPGSTDAVTRLGILARSRYGMPLGGLLLLSGLYVGCCAAVSSCAGKGHAGQGRARPTRAGGYSRADVDAELECLADEFEPLHHAQPSAFHPASTWNSHGHGSLASQNICPSPPSQKYLVMFKYALHK